MAANTFNPSTQEAEAGGSPVSSRPACVKVTYSSVLIDVCLLPQSANLGLVLEVSSFCII
jgi:hypothetical protein